MNVEEELRNGRPTSASSPLYRAGMKQHLGQADIPEAANEAMEDPDGHELVGSD